MGLDALLAPALQVLMRQVVEELWSSGFVTCNKIEAHVSGSLDLNVMDQFTGLSKWVVIAKRQFTDPNGMHAKIEGRLKGLENRQAGDSIKRGGKAFQDISAITWVQTFEDKDLYCYCVDMVTLAMLCAEPYETITEGMATAAAAHKAKYNSLTEA
jgi:hypothetical protein